MNFLSALKLVGPLVLKGVNVAVPIIPLIIKGIEIAEQIGEDEPDRKPRKKELAKEIIELSAQVANKTTGTNAFDPSEVARIADETIDIVIRATNELKNKN